MVMAMDTAMGTTTKAKTDQQHTANRRQQFFARLAQALHLVGNLALAWAQRLLFRANPKVRSILIFRTGSFGDSLCAIPAIASIRKNFPDARIDMLTNTGHFGKSLVSIDQLIGPGILNRVLHYQNQPRRQILKLIRNGRYDLVIQLPQYNAAWYRLLRDMVFFRFGAGIRAGFGWQWNGAPIFRQAREAVFFSKNERLRLLEILEKNDVPPLPETTFALNWTDSDRVTAGSKLEAVIPATGKPLIAVVAGAKRSQNRWPAAYFNAVCRHFSGRFNLVLLGGPDDASLAGQIQQNEPGVYSLCGQLSPMQNAWVIKQCRLVLSNDTGLMHLSYAVGAPLVALFSARDLPGRWYPPNRPNVRILRHFGLACSACLSDRCNRNICMEKIEVAQVIGEMENLLGNRNL
ncbi:MAG: glycosyltransferase family 9 protein [Lewinellaceae bacterium]|nr:glycosyltransferase family 9 protein [Lewinellaceae bacterium]